jgi:peptide/nickel transport system ATP-binding protein
MTVLDPRALLEVRGLRTWFPIRSGVLRRVTGYVRAVDGVDLTLFPGETLALVGESGCGKTTVGRSILRLVEPVGGNIWFEGQNVTRLSLQDFHPYRRRIQIVMQDPGSALDPRFTIRDAIAEGMESFGIGKNQAERTERVAELMRKVSLDPGTMWRYPHEFSGGQRQRICIARALAVDPSLLICDEATSALDVSIQAQILNLLADLQGERNLAYLFITHDLGVVRYFADRVAVMYLGRIVETAPTERIFSDPRHPYTKALLASIPSLDPARRRTKPAALGDVPSPDKPPPGCPYHPRCVSRLPHCSRETPPAVAFPDGMSRCFLALEALEMRANALTHRQPDEKAGVRRNRH